MSSLKETVENKEIALIDILDVILDKGVAIRGDILISIAGVDLVYLDLRVLISSVETLVQSHEYNVEKVLSQNFDKQRGELIDAASKPDGWKN